eukprot:TRINITY_DN217_c1_g2_i1.p1 TRINITY_DN217_c1_g2~~TRINITY_DN217_c1_g2_i1.p1  ORF type:complete len:405 (-),score=134.28 TRINITY_DN217_c1_g2_i1:137-1207(-)
MDLLRDILKEKEAEVKKTFNGKRYRSRGEIEREKEEKLAREQEKREEEERERKRRKLEEEVERMVEARQRRSSSGVTSYSKDGSHSEKAEKDGKDKLQEVSKEEIIRRLRVLKEPATVFGENDLDRIERLRRIIKEQGDATKGQRNEFHKLLLMDEEAEKMARLGKRAGADAKDDKSHAGTKMGPIELPDPDSFQPDVTASKADQLTTFYRRVLQAWDKHLDHTRSSHSVDEYRRLRVQYKQTVEWIQLLFKGLKKGTLSEEIPSHLFDMMNSLLTRNFEQAEEIYMELSIGNAAWPMGVTMVGIHERTAREKIETSKVAHVMNDEDQRKFIHAVKRISTFYEKYVTKIFQKTTSH